MKDTIEEKHNWKFENKQYLRELTKFMDLTEQIKDKELKEMRENLNVGDKVTTIGGIIAHVAKVEENAVILEIGPNRTKVPFEKWAIGKVESKEA